jgi:Mrp family chromosome partitioning ATPase/predicted Fe-Mo cluster-binding NifX family protein
MGRIAHKLLVLSGKGGVGKSTVAVNLAVSLMHAGKRVGLLDADIHGPSVPRMLGLEGERPLTEGEDILPVEVGDLKVMSIGFLLNGREEAVIWRGPMKMSVIAQFLRDVEWGDLDYLVVDVPPGTGDEPLSVCQLIEDADGAVVVTTPQKVALAAVRRSITFCRRLDLPVLGVVENMSGYVCPACGERTEIFGSGGGESLAREMGVPFLGRIPIERGVTVSGDSGVPYAHTHAGTAAGRAFAEVIQPILGTPASPAAKEREERTMRVAIPVAAGKLCQHFGHCETFVLIDVDPKARTMQGKQELQAPEHQPGLLPRWLAERGAELIIAGGMGSRAQSLFAESGITVVAGASADTPENLVTAYLAGTLARGENVCDH